MKDRLIRLRRRPAIAHAERAGLRFTERLGLQFAAAITYFSVLALVPILMLAFSILGFVLVELRPGLIDDVVTAVADAIGGVDQRTKANVVAVIDNALRNYTAVGVVGLVSAAYSGSGWINNLKKAVRAQCRPSFDDAEPQQNIALRTLINFGTLLGLLAMVAVTFAIASFATALTDNALGWLGLSTTGWVAVTARVVPVLASLAAGWVLFVYLYTVLPSRRMPWPAVRRGALLGSIGLGILQYLTSFLFGTFAGNLAASLFGPIIAVMLFFNLFSILILAVAAWIATWSPRITAPADELAGTIRAVMAASHAAAEPAGEVVPRPVAVRSVRVGLGAGYLTGAVTGAGLGALVAATAARIARRR